MFGVTNDGQTDNLLCKLAGARFAADIRMPGWQTCHKVKGVTLVKNQARTLWFLTRCLFVNFSRNFEQPFTPQTSPFDPNMHSNEISATSRSPHSQILSPVRPQADEKTPKNPNAQTNETLNDCLPLKNWPYRPQTW